MTVLIFWVKAVEHVIAPLGKAAGMQPFLC